MCLLCIYIHIHLYLYLSLYVCINRGCTHSLSLFLSLALSRSLSLTYTLTYTRRSFNCLGGAETETLDQLGEPKCIPNVARSGEFQCQGGYKEGCQCLDSNDLVGCSGGCLCSPVSCCKVNNCSRPLVCIFLYIYVYEYLYIDVHTCNVRVRYLSTECA